MKSFGFVDLPQVANLRLRQYGGIRRAHRPDSLPLSHSRKTRWRRDGCGVQGPRHVIGPLCCSQVPTRGLFTSQCSCWSQNEQKEKRQARTHSAAARTGEATRERPIPEKCRDQSWLLAKSR